VHKPQNEKKTTRVVKQKRTTWTYEDENGRDLGQDYLEQQKLDQNNNVSFYSFFIDSHMFFLFLLFLLLEC
jgi:uncharacterized protein (DUF2225 family)